MPIDAVMAMLEQSKEIFATLCGCEVASPCACPSFFNRVEHFAAQFSLFNCFYTMRDSFILLAALLLTVMGRAHAFTRPDQSKL